MVWQRLTFLTPVHSYSVLLSRQLLKPCLLSVSFQESWPNLTTIYGHAFLPWTTTVRTFNPRHLIWHRIHTIVHVSKYHDCFCSQWELVLILISVCLCNKLSMKRRRVDSRDNSVELLLLRFLSLIQKSPQETLICFALLRPLRS